jgi:pimeloyl-ACP methyl ester carboxylesterase
MPRIPSHRASIYYEVHGEGPAVVFAHGAEGNTLSWFQQVPFFSRRFRVVTFDHRGFGRSECHPDAQHTSYYADDLRAVLDAEGIARAALVGHSIGGWTCLRTAIEYPERVSCLVLASTAGGLITPSLLHRMAEGAVRVARGEEVWKQLLSPAASQRDPERAFLFEQIYSLNPPLDPGRVSEATEVQVHPEELTGYAVPTLVLLPGLDVWNNRDLLREAVRAIPGVKTVDLDELGSATHFEAPDLFNRIVSEFVSQHV